MRAISVLLFLPRLGNLLETKHTTKCLIHEVFKFLLANMKGANKELIYDYIRKIEKGSEERTFESEKLQEIKS